MNSVSTVDDSRLHLTHIVQVVVFQIRSNKPVELPAPGLSPKRVVLACSACIAAFASRT